MASLLDIFNQSQPMQPGLPQDNMQSPVGSPVGNNADLSMRIQQWLGAKPADQGGMAQSILGARFEPTMQDVGQAASQSVGAGQYVAPESVAASRNQPVMEMLSRLYQVQQMQIGLAKIQEEMRHNRVTEGENPNALSISSFPTPAGGSGGGGNIIPNANPFMMGGGMNSPKGGPVPLISGNSSPAGGADQQILSIFDNADNGGGGAQPQAQPQTQPNAQYTPLYRGNTPYTEGLPQGKQWAQGSDGKMVAVQVPGTVEKGANGEVLSTDPKTGETTQHIPVNPQAQAKLESNLQELAQKIGALHKAGGTLETGGGFFGNKLNQLESTKGLELPYVGQVLPGGQSIMQGSETQTLRDDIQGLVKQTLPLYMQAMGITPGMERAVGAQQMLQEALGGGVDKSRQHLMFSLQNLSKQAGTGELAGKLSAYGAARDAIAKGANAQAVKQRLQASGFDPAGLE